jgi:hypothetical protein
MRRTAKWVKRNVIQKIITCVALKASTLKIVYEKILKKANNWLIILDYLMMEVFSVVFFALFAF